MHLLQELFNIKAAISEALIQPQFRKTVHTSRQQAQTMFRQLTHRLLTRQLDRLHDTSFALDSHQFKISAAQISGTSQKSQTAKSQSVIYHVHHLHMCWLLVLSIMFLSGDPMSVNVHSADQWTTRAMPYGHNDVLRQAPQWDSDAPASMTIHKEDACGSSKNKYVTCHLKLIDIFIKAMCGSNGKVTVNTLDTCTF